MQMTVSLSDADLLARLKNFKDHFVERKTSGDKRDWLKTVVAFANSAPNGYPPHDTRGTGQSWSI